jgi:hypothetical protein
VIAHKYTGTVPGTCTHLYILQRQDGTILFCEILYILFSSETCRRLVSCPTKLFRKVTTSVEAVS